ncbi:hypothetical protein SmJEL517_g01361 [Synchytrium microbalum]|uniref:Uncharacterized protein n=1 Tax=Synchytrium microbalum TaxID=1806994 RepID=A0A507CBG1_9FUNG|nr:uncharacterized protein SmJEL517_g01361 [Synchytrium microbalum]TPX36668.1 hypothetical protein SmJEL517_g01361 [Synchytrium microbalum]
MAAEKVFGENVSVAANRKRSAQRIRPKILSSLPLQVFLYSSKYLYVVWTGAMISVLVIKSLADSSPSTPNLFMYTLFAGFMLLEPLRIFMGYTGNLREQVGELAICVILGILQIVICVYFVNLQQLAGSSPLPWEFGINIAYIIWLVPQIFLAVLAGNRFIQAQNQAFLLSLDEHTGLLTSTPTIPPPNKKALL